MMKHLLFLDKIIPFHGGELFATKENNNITIKYYSGNNHIATKTFYNLVYGDKIDILGSEWKIVEAIQKDHMMQPPPIAILEPLTYA